MNYLFYRRFPFRQDTIGTGTVIPVTGETGLAGASAFRMTVKTGFHTRHQNVGAFFAFRNLCVTGDAGKRAMDRVIEAAVDKILFPPLDLGDLGKFARDVSPGMTLETDLPKEAFFSRKNRTHLLRLGRAGSLSLRFFEVDLRIFLQLGLVKLNEEVPNLFRFLVRDDRPGEFEIESQGMTIPTLFFMVERGVPINPLGVVLDIRSMTVTAGERHFFPIGSFQIRFQMNLVVEFDGNGIFIAGGDPALPPFPPSDFL